MRNNFSLKTGFWFVLLGISVISQGPKLAQAYYPASDSYLDFVQEWLSARNYWTGHPVYEYQLTAMERHTGEKYDVSQMAYAWNAHPPASVLVALPFGLTTDYHFSHFLWNLITFSLFLAAGFLIIQELQLKFSVEGWCVLLLLLLWAFPILSHLSQGQLNFALAFLLVLGWRADRREQPWLCGLCLGTAAGLKLFPGLLLVYLLFARRWTSWFVAVLTIVAWQVLALSVFGLAEFQTYLSTALPSLDAFRVSLINQSLAGMLSRWGRSVGNPPLFNGVTLFAQLSFTTLLAYASWRSSSTDSRDRVVCASVVALPLLSPVAWTHYHVLLILPLLWLWTRLSTNLHRLFFSGLVILFSMPDYVFLRLTHPSEPPLGFQGTLASTSNYVISSEPFTLGLIGLFVMVMTSTRKADEAAH